MSTATDLADACWRKSSYSNGDGGMCVEVAANVPDAIRVRDSKHPDGPALHFAASAWASFIRTL